MLKSKIRALVLLGPLLMVSSIRAEDLPATPTKDLATSDIDSIVSGMSTSEKAGQLFLYGFAGSTDNRDIRYLSESLKPGGLIVFSRNIKSPAHLKHILLQSQTEQRASGRIPLFFAIDQEGGTVVRIKMSPPLPSALSLGRANKPELSRKIGLLGGTILRDLGLNVNLAPVLDLSSPSIASFVGTRSFGASPELVGLHARELSQGLFASGVLPTAKHFPGHGLVTADSHHELPSKAGTIDELLQKDLKPFSEVFSTNLPSAVMVAHMMVPDIDPSGAPATYSSILLKDVLRKKMAFKGLIITDDLEMSGASSGGSPDERAIRALRAGADMVMVAWNRKHQIRALKGVIAAINEGRLDMAAVESSVRRILQYKKELGLFNGLININRAPASEPRDIYRELADSINGVVAINLNLAFSENPGLVTRARKAQSVVVFSTSREFLSGLVSSDAQGGRRVYPFSRSGLDQFSKELHRTHFGIYHVSGPKSYRSLMGLPAKLRAKVLVVNTDDPALIQRPNSFFGVLNIASKHPRLGNMLARTLWPSEVDLSDQAERLPAAKVDSNDKLAAPENSP